MKHFYATLLALFTVSFMVAQCNYTLEMRDAFGDGWGNGSQMTVTLNGTSTVYTVPSSPGNINTVVFAVNDGDTLVLDYIADSVIPGENEFTLFDSEGLIIVDSGFSPATGNFFDGMAACPTCPVVTNLTASNVVANSALISWVNGGGGAMEWEIEYGISPYTLGSGGQTMPVTGGLTEATIMNLQSMTNYDFYVRAICSPTDSSSFQGPLQITTTISCPAPVSFAPVTQTSNNVQFIWDPNGNPSPTFEVEYGLENFNQGFGTVVTQFTAPFASVTGLASDTCYDFYVRIDCGAGDFSAWSGPYNACTSISCFPVTNLQVGNLSPTSIELNWVPGQNETDWEVEYAIENTITTPFSNQGTVINVSNNPTISINNLTDSTVYDIYVRAACDSANLDFSVAEAVTTSTLCLPIAATTAVPYTEDFEAFTANTDFVREDCWTASFVGTNPFTEYDWNVTTDGSTPTGGTGALSGNSGLSYMYIETGGNDGDTATLFSPIINVDGLTEPSVQFFYHLNGDNIGDLSVDVFDGSVWQVGLFTSSGPLQTATTDPFEQGIINLAGFTGDIQVRFVATRTGTTTGDISIDDFSVEEAPLCAPVALLNTGVINAMDAEITWQVQGTEASWIVEYGPVGFTPGTSATDPEVFEVTTSNNPYLITGLDPNTVYDFYVVADCGMGTLASQIGPSTFTTTFLPPQGVNCPGMDNVIVFQEEFEMNLNGWTGDLQQVDSVTNGDWIFNAPSTGSTGTGPDAPFSGGGFAYFESSGTNTAPARIVSPAIDLSFATDGAELSFYYLAFGASIDTFEVNIGNSPSGPFTNEFTSVGEVQTTGSDPWLPVGLNLDAYVGQVIYIELTATEANNAGTTGDIAIDLLQIETCGSFCAPPNSLSAANIVSDGVQIDFVDGNPTPAGNYEVLVQLAGDPAPDAMTTGIQQTTMTNSHSWTGLTPLTMYDAYVRTDCMGATGFSVWVGPITFQTACSSFPAPYFEDFETFTFTLNFVEENCWSGNATTNFDWNIEDDGQTPSGSTGPLGAFSDDTYFYTEASGAGVGEIAELISPIVDYSTLTNPSIQFYYHMFGDDIGTLHVDVNDGTAWFNDVAMIVGQQQASMADDWIEEVVDISAIAGLTGTEISVRFRAESNGTFNGDISIDDFRINEIPTCPAPSNLAVDDVNVTITSAPVSWIENGTATMYDIEWGPANYTQGMPPAAPLGGMDTNISMTSYTINGLQGSTSYDYYVRAVCGAGDVSFWVGPFTFETLCDVLAAPYFQDFESFAPVSDFAEQACWTGSATTSFDWNVEDNGETPSTGTGPLGAFSGDNYFFTEASSSTAGSTAELTLPLTDLSPLTNPSLQFWYHMFGAQIGSLEIQVDDQLGGGFVTIATIGPGQQQTAMADDWLFQIVNLSAYAGQTVGIRFVGISGGTFEGDISLDDVSVDEIPACPNPSMLSVANITDTMADLSWSENGLATVWSVEVQLQGDPQGTMPAVYSNAMATNPVQATGLAPDTLYDFYVQSDCGVDGTSNWVGPFTFRTECAPLIAPYIEDFETFTSNVDFVEENCWKATFNSTTFTEFDWNVTDTGDTPSLNTGPNSAFNGVKFFYIEGNGGTTGSEAILLSPLVDVSTLTNPSFQFNYHMFGSNTGDLHVDINDGTGFVNDVVLIQGQQQIDGNSPWELSVVDLSAFTGTVVQVRFRVDKPSTSALTDISIDNVIFDELPACAQPSVLTSANITDVSAELSWNENGMATSWIIEYGLCNFALGTGTTVVANSNTDFLITGLDDQECYEFYVTADCGMGTLSGVAGPGRFTTQCGAFIAPYTEGFETFTVTTTFAEENCWSTPQLNSYTWDVSTGGTPSLNTGPQIAATGLNYFFTEATGGNIGDEAELFSPLIDISALTSPALTFSYHMHGGDMGDLHVDINDGTGFVNDVALIQGEQQAAQGDSWLTLITDLTPFAGSTIQVRFRGTRGPDFESDIAIDDVVVDDFNGCLVPSNIVVTNITGSSADFTWTAGGSETTWEYVNQLEASGLPTGAGTSTMMMSGSASSLASSTLYEVYVRADCGMGNFSDWVGPIVYQTDCAPISAPYGSSAGAPGNDFVIFPGTCWSEGDATQVAAGPNGLDGDWQSDVFANDPVNADDSAVINIWSNGGDADWLVTPEFDLSVGGPFSAIFDIAHTDFNSSLATTFGSDDQVQLVLTDDGGVNWTAIQTWDATTPISNTGEQVIVDLSAYTGVIQMAFWGTNGTTVDNASDTEFFVDNFTIDAPLSKGSVEELGFTFYPNSVKDVLNIDGIQNIDTVSVMNMLGQQVMTVEPGVANVQIDMSTLSSGVYLLRVTTNNNLSTIRVVKE